MPSLDCWTASGSPRCWGPGNGPRQCGKTTLARTFAAADFFDLENPEDLARLDNPQLALEPLEGLIVIDEIQRKPELFPLLRYLVDTNPGQKYLILGSASRDLIRQSSESLAGRIAYYELSGFRIHDVPREDFDRLWLRGALPPAFTAETSDAAFLWLENYIATFLERDIPALGIHIPPNTLLRFWRMLAFYHGNVLNHSELARAFGVSNTAIRRYLDILQGTFMIRLLQPWHANEGKRLVKSPKLYIRDSGIYHSLLDVSDMRQLQSTPKIGVSWEGFALEVVWRSVGKRNEHAHFWATHAGAETDLFWRNAGRNWACEFKYADSPKTTKSMRSAIESLELDYLWIVYPGRRSYQLDSKIEVLSIHDVPEKWSYERLGAGSAE